MIRDIKVVKGATADRIIREMKEAGGFMAKNLAQAVDVLEMMIKDQDCTRFLSFTANLLATGIRGIITHFVRKRYFHVIVTTAGSIDHDFSRGSGAKYEEGSFFMDDAELRRKGVNRVGNVLIPNESFTIFFEDKVQPILREIFEERDKISTYELCWELGNRLGEDSFLYWASKHRIPVIVPGITDGAIGYQLYLFSQEKKVEIDLMADMELLSDYVFNAKKTGALILGGGISKHHVIGANLFRGGLDYAVYITSAVEYDGSLSGARPREGVSWGKIKEKANKVYVWGEITSVLPLIAFALEERLSRGHPKS